MRDVDFVKNKFHKLSNAKKPTENPSCPPHTRHAKRTACNILAKTHSISLGMNSSVDNVENDAEHIDTSPRVGERKKRRKFGSLGVKKEKETDPFVKHVRTMAQSIFEYFDEASSRNDALKNVQQELTEAESDVAAIKLMLQQLLVR